MNFWETFGPDGPFKVAVVWVLLLLPPSLTRDLRTQVNMAFIFHARVIALRDMGACQNPFGSFMLLQGLETLALRGRVRR